MISKEFIKVLARLTGITDKAILKYPITTLNSDAIDMIVNINTEKFGCLEFQDTGIYELNKFVHMFNLFENPEITRTENAIVFETPGTKSVYTVSDIDVMSSFNQKSSIIESLENYPSISEVSITADTMKQIKTAAGIFSELNVVTIEGKNGDTNVYLDAHNRFNSSNNSFLKEFLNTSSKDFKLKINVDNFMKIPVEDYTLKIKYNSEKDAYRILFESDNYKILVSRVAE